jgi:glycosyltransferase involved in cell wall biosynthesis
VAGSRLRILQVSIADVLGGAEKVAWSLFRAYRARGHESWLAVGRKRGDDPDVLPLPNEALRGRWARWWQGLDARLQRQDWPGSWRLSRLAHWLAEPGRALNKAWGVEDFRFPGTWRLLRLPPRRPSLIHCHNLHGDYFDLRALPWLSRQVPVLLTLHDAWLLSGHCSHSFACERWQTGCGHCPDLTLSPAVARDATAYNWRRKRRLYRRSRLYVATPSRWLMDKVERSMLAEGLLQGRVVPNGVDLSVFQPADRQAVRAALDIPPAARMLLFTANNIRENPAKDYGTIQAAVAGIAERLPGQRVLFVALGHKGPAEPLGSAAVRCVPFQRDAQAVAQYYQAADVYLHASHVDTFPNAVLEALACGTPVVATAVGGIPEQVKSLAPGAADPGGKTYDADEATGVLVPVRGADQMARAGVHLLTNRALHRQLSTNAVRDAEKRFDLRRQVDSYLEWYQEMVSAAAQPQATGPGAKGAGVLPWYGWGGKR